MINASSSKTDVLAAVHQQDAYASEALQIDPDLLQQTNLSYLFLLKALSALAVRISVLSLGVFMLGRFFIHPVDPVDPVGPAYPVIIGAALTITGLVSTGFFAHKIYQHQAQFLENSSLTRITGY